MEEKINEILRENLGLKEDEINRHKLIEEDLGADSLDMVELCMAVEHEFDLQIADEEFAKVKTVGNLYDMVAVYVENKKAVGQVTV